MLSLPCTAYDRILLCLFLVFLTLFWAFLTFQIHPSVLYLCAADSSWAEVPPAFLAHKVPLRGSNSDKERLTVCAQKHRLPAFCCLRNKGISPSSFAPIFRHIWRFAEISNPFYYISPKLLCCRKKLLTSHANPWYTHQTIKYRK